MAIWEIKRFLNKDKDLTLDDLLAAKVVCKGPLGTSFEITNKDGVYPKFTITLEASDEDSGKFKKKFVNIRPGSYSVKITNLGTSTTIDLDDVKLGEVRKLAYTLAVELAKLTSPITKEVQVPSGLKEVTVTAIAAGGTGGKGGNGDYNKSNGGAGGGGGGAGQSVVNKTYSVTPGQKISITVGAVSQATVIGSLVTLQPGVAGTNGNKTSIGKGGAIGGTDGGANNGRHGGQGGNGGPGIDENGKPVAAAKGGAGGGAGSSSAPEPGANGTGYGSGGAGGGGGVSSNSAPGAEGGQPTGGFVHIFATLSIA